MEELEFCGKVLNDGLNMWINDVCSRNTFIIYIKELVSQMIELNFVSEIQDKISELKELYDSTDSRDLQNKALWQIEILEEVALPYAKTYNYNLDVLSECRYKLYKRLEGQN